MKECTPVSLNHALVRLNITPVSLDITQVSLNNAPVTLFIACENSRPSSLPAEWRFAKRHSAGSEDGRLFSQATLFTVRFQRWK